MNKIKAFAVAAAMSAFGIGMVSASAANSVFSDNFDSYSVGGLGSASGGAWVSRGGVVVEGDAARGNVAKIEDNDANNIMYISTAAYTKAQNEYIVYIWDYMTDNPTNDQRMIIYGITADNEEKKALQLRTYQADGNLRLEYQDGSSGGWSELCGLEAGKWYHFRAEVSYAGTGGSVSLYVDGENIFSNHAVMQSAVIAAPQHKLVFGTNTNKTDTGTMYIDNVSVSSLGTYSELFSDDFDSYTSGGGLGGQSGGVWTSKGGTVAECIDVNCAKVTDESASDSMYISAPKQEVSDAAVTYEWDYMSDTLSADQRIIVSGVAADGSEKKIIQMRTYQDNGSWRLQYQNSSAWSDICEFKTGEVYHFKLNIDFANIGTVLSVNGKSVFTDGGFMASAAASCPEHKITFGTPNAKSDTGIMYIDNLMIYLGERYSQYPDLSNLTFYCKVDGSTKTVSALESGEIIVRSKLVNLSDEVRNAVLVTALYRDDVLVDLDTHTGDGHSNKKTCFEPDTVQTLYCSVDADIPAGDTSVWKLKTYLWESGDKMIPLCQEEVLNQ